MNISVIVPAYNETKCIATTLQSIQDAFRGAGITLHELIVSDDASTDDTATLAATHGATVVESGKRNIGATRNVGAAAATGDVLLFVDADTLIHPSLIVQMIDRLERGAVGGGALVRFSGPATRWGQGILFIWNCISRLMSYPAGAFLFVRRDVFNAIGGFDERYYASEELHLGRAMKRHGRVVILPEAFATSPRKVHQFSAGEFLWFFCRLAVRPFGTVRNRDQLDIWYERR